MRRASVLSCHRLAGFVLAATLIASGAEPSAAQGFFGNFFGGFGPRQVAPPYPYDGRQGDPGFYAPRRPRHRRVEQAPRDNPVAAPKNTIKATIFVDVLGDSFGQLLANGLDDALSDRQNVGVLHLGRGSSGLVARDYYDWPKVVDELLAGKTKIDVAVMMIGSNDRQAIHADGKTYDRGTDEWKRIYAQRVMAIDEAFRNKGVPLIWVGVPITRDGNFADDMAALNDIYRDAAAKTGATYVDTWEAFSDDDGDFDATGPDVNGQTVRLRTSDGIYFTKAGARKLAHFVEAHVRRDLDGKAPLAPPPVGAPTEASVPQKPPPAAPVAIVKPDAGPIRNLDDAPVSADGELATRASLAARTDVGDDPTAKSPVTAAPAGRADDLKWAAGRTPEP